MADRGLNTTKLMTGSGGRLYISQEGKHVFLAEVDSFRVWISAKNIEYTPVGSRFAIAVPDTLKATLEFSEAVVTDELLALPLLEALNNAQQLSFSFKGELDRGNDTGDYQTCLYKDCVIDGDIDISNVKPGEIIRRKWRFRINQIPELVDTLI